MGPYSTTRQAHEAILTAQPLRAAETNGRRVGDPWHRSDRTVLVALQDAVAAGRLAKRFSDQDVVPTLAFSCDQLLQQAREGRYSLIVVDEALVADDGSRCLDQVHEVSQAPIMALGGLSEEEHPVLEIAFPTRADPGAIVAHGSALIEMGRPVPLPHPLRWGGLELDLRTHQARWEGRPLHLTTVQFRIMEVLVLAAGAVVTPEQLARRVWGEASFDDGDRLVAHIRRIRKLIERDSSIPQFLLRVRGTGFRLAEGGESIAPGEDPASR